MTQQEQAKELVNKFLESLYDNGSLSFKKILYPKAKQCALIAVDELLNELFEMALVTGSSYVHKHIDYYQEVKQEIEKL